MSPCIDVPLASVQIERTDSLEMIPKSRKTSEIPTQKQRGSLAASMKYKEQESSEDQGYSSMNGTSKDRNSDGSNKTDCVNDPLLESPRQKEWDDSNLSADNSPTRSYIHENNPMSESPYTTYNGEEFDEMVGSYVPSGYILLNQSNDSSAYVSNFHTEIGRSSV